MTEAPAALTRTESRGTHHRSAHSTRGTKIG
ncbi:MAG: hypothetical protein ACE5OW_06755 [Candidatus Bathyarchaeia archaeon]